MCWLICGYNDVNVHTTNWMACAFHYDLQNVHTWMCVCGMHKWEQALCMTCLDVQQIIACSHVQLLVWYLYWHLLIRSSSWRDNINDLSICRWLSWFYVQLHWLPWWVKLHGLLTWVHGLHLIHWCHLN